MPCEHLSKIEVTHVERSLWLEILSYIRDSSIFLGKMCQAFKLTTTLWVRLSEKVRMGDDNDGQGCDYILHTRGLIIN